MPTNRRPVSRRPKVQITPAAIAVYRRLRAWDDQHTCPEEDPPYPGRVSNSADPTRCEMQRQYEAERDGYDAACAACEACKEAAADEVELLRALGIRLKPWERGLEDLPSVVAALEKSA